MFDLAHIRVHDVMHHGILGCPADAPLDEVAGIMADNHVHAVAVTNGAGGRPAGVISALDVVAAIWGDQSMAAAQAAATEPLTISASESLHRAAQLMTEHGVSHLVVLDAAGGHPIGVLSTLDIASVYANNQVR